jgi:hypothetical protein
MEFLRPDVIAQVTGAPLPKVAANWHLVCAALEVDGMNSALVQVGMAATIAIETGDFEPKRERRAQLAGPAHDAQQRYWPSGFYGRGYIQLTWRENYKVAGDAIGADLVADPDLALRPDLAAKIAVWFFRWKGLHRKCDAMDWPGLRRSVNGDGYAKDAASLKRFIGYCDALRHRIGPLVPAGGAQ